MQDVIYEPGAGVGEPSRQALQTLLARLTHPFKKGDRVGVKLHWGEKGNHTFLPPVFAKEIVKWLSGLGASPFIFDTTVLYSGSRRTGEDSLKTAAAHGYSTGALGCPVIIADGLDGRDTIDIPAGYRHFDTIQAANVFDRAEGFVIFSHFKGHMASGFGGAIKNLAMGFASRAQKQRMHADARPKLKKKKCTRCGLCVEVCPTGAACFADDAYPVYDLDLCIGCAQCIGLCPEVALEILWNTDDRVFQEKLVETAVVVWRKIEGRTIVINALLNIASECDCLPGRHPVIAPDSGFIGGNSPVTVDEASVRRLGEACFDNAHPHADWRRQFSYSREIGFI
ncbi:MAG: 4Fe-4S ferredoxin [Syntrophus sp. (in: bacteria)]|nr:4Fe-4S ferredoxin [Syntrophus sp. (in: bacteria)]